MQSLEIDGLKEVIQTLETTPEVIRQARAEFQGKYMYRNTGQQEAKRAAEEGARIIEAKILAHMEGRSV